jgi:hypothetical protein
VRKVASLFYEHVAGAKWCGDGGDVVGYVLASVVVADYQVGGLGEGDVGIAFS